MPMTRLSLFALLLLSGASYASEPGKPAITPQTSQSGGPLDPAQEKIKLSTVDLAIEVDPDREVINGTATLVLHTIAKTDRIVLDLDKNYTVTSATVDGVDAASYADPDGRLTIKLLKKAKADTDLTIKIIYGGRPHSAVRAPWDGGFVWDTTPDGKPWIATAVQMEGCDLIWPCIDYPTYEPDKIDLHITVPRGLEAPSNGKLIGVDELPDGRSTWNWEARNPTLYGVALNVGPYEEISGEYKSRFGNTIPMHYWYLPGEKAQAEKLFAEFAPTLDFFESVIGPYPFGDEKLGVVETPHKGMELQTINAYGNNYAKTPWGFDDLFQHEFSHEWFANQLTAANWDDFWLHEGFAAYMQPLYGKWRRGDGVYTAMML
ncbi:MAG: M1 family metallopeptidase, partial [Sphingomonas bacterium]|nr:M1 family metallopeptidase [Sphingomonas bacterium]